jgi:hypothetical protein
MCVIGEGEETLVELTNALGAPVRRDQRPGIRSADGGVMSTGPGPIRKLDDDLDRRGTSFLLELPGQRPGLGVTVGAVCRAGHARVP